VRCAKALLIGRYPKQELEQDLQDLKDLYRDAALGPSTAIIKEAEAYPGSPSALLYGSTGLRRKPKADATMSAQTSILGVELASDKEGTNASSLMLEYQCQKAQFINYLDELVEAIEAVGGYPIVIKPLMVIMVGASPLISDPGQRQSQPTMPPKCFPVGDC